MGERLAVRCWRNAQRIEETNAGRSFTSRRRSLAAVPSKDRSTCPPTLPETGRSVHPREGPPPIVFARSALRSCLSRMTRAIGTARTQTTASTDQKVQ